jgi:hypothetical protein
MSTATTTEPTTSQTSSRRTTTQPTNTPTSQLERSAANRLRNTMAAVKLSFTWLGVRKTLAPEQRTTAARAFHADRERLGLRLLAGLAGVLRRDQRFGVTAPKTDPGTISKTVSKRPLGAEILRRAPRAVPEEFARPRYDRDLFFGLVSTHNPLVVCSNHTGPSCF